eukprot:scaffold34902_cov59-Phaeocystis_antarctica.AAC.2
MAPATLGFSISWSTEASISRSSATLVSSLPLRSVTESMSTPLSTAPILRAATSPTAKTKFRAIFGERRLGERLRDRDR